MTTNLLEMRTGRPLEVVEYGDPHGRPAFFFHGLIGSHYQASYVALQAAREGLRIIAPNRPGVGRSEFVRRSLAIETADDVEDVAQELGLDRFSVIGISGGTPYALAALSRMPDRIETVTIISGMGPTRLKGALAGMDQRRRMILAAGSRYPQVALRIFEGAGKQYRADPERFLRKLVATWSTADRKMFQRREVFDLFLKDLEQVFSNRKGEESLAQELLIYRNHGFTLSSLPRSRLVTLWQGLDDNIVPATMAWKLVNALPNAEVTIVPGGHFMAIDMAPRIVARLDERLRPG
jgi:pimeloyl-ACP methyl ester carboxylesterase